MVTRDLVVPPLDASDFVILWAYGPNGERLQDIQVSTGVRSSHGIGGGGGTALRRSDGSWVVLHFPITGPSSDRKPADTIYEVTVHSPRFGDKSVQYRRDETSEITVTFGDPCVLHVTVEGFRGSGKEDALRVALVGSGAKSSGSMMAFQAVPLDTEGTASFGPYEPGAYDIVLGLAASRSSVSTIGRFPVTLSQGLNDVTVTLPELYSVTLLVGDSPSKDRLYLERIQGDFDYRRAYGTPEENGAIRFSDLPAGRYELRDRSGRMPIEIPRDQILEFAPKPVNARRVTVEDPSGYLAEAGFGRAIS